MGIDIKGFTAAPVILAALYLFLAMYSGQRLLWLHTMSPSLNTRKMFAMNCFLTCVLRVMSFTSIAVLKGFNYGNNDDDNESASQAFFEKSLIVLFDFPDFSIISAYVLLAIVWSDAFIQVGRCLEERHQLYLHMCKTLYVYQC